MNLSKFQWAIIALSAVILLAGGVWFFSSVGEGDVTIPDSSGIDPAFRRLLDEPGNTVFEEGGRLVSPPLIPTKEGCVGLAEGDAKEGCIDEFIHTEVISNAKSIDQCLGIYEDGYRNDCLFRVGRESGDPKKCAMISTVSLRERCIASMAVDKAQAGICDSLDDSHEAVECKDRVLALNLAVLAAGKESVSVCGGITSLEYSKLCLVNALRSDIPAEGQIKNKTVLDQYSSWVQYREARDAKDCAKIPLESAKTVCTYKLSNTEFILDYDKDGIPDEKELWFNTDPTKFDTDGDGLGDGDEFLGIGSDPLSTDKDGDGLSDGIEVNDYGSNPGDRDTNQNGKTDKEDVDAGLCPTAFFELSLSSGQCSKGTFLGRSYNLPVIFAGNYGEVLGGFATKNCGDLDDAQKKMMVQLDFDKDGLTDFEEVCSVRTDPVKNDTDGDGLDDGDEVNISKTSPLKKDTDGNGKSDMEDLRAKLLL
ncbi:MAG: hypothetical protein G01um101418_657 [Parcubacteria group bacterium Gr01-1014_18]|nr:MAG: hypothetical protein Greene041636_632 [Parcubacteria group bacterium Greene0416_36]TSC80738.1 MAG: hypothetical protein G01um101418_657 [Parcubacteria group bacterium Gr01-1014_18]TSC98651.1 MAG: hypothetical protein Greene101420_610 [Parcubacteria group bacterium Greene1014_20]TSD07189.1 MAG: hypothetical protein Greene07142_358 [Parcubacteria group bacterium Greene0714_2]